MDFLGVAATWHARNKFAPNLEKIKRKLEDLNPILNELKKLNEKLNLQDPELSALIRVMEEGAVLIRECSDVKWYNFFQMLSFEQKLEEFDECLSRSLVTLGRQIMVRDQKETCRIIREVHDQIMNKQGTAGLDGPLEELKKRLPTPQVQEYDVFLSFRGQDTGKGFTSHLYRALLRKEIKTFFADFTLERGEDLSSGLIEAIQGSRSSILILSENYAFSRWCLMELCKIVECKDSMKMVVVPIFYHVDPSKLVGQYENAFNKYESNGKYSLKKVMARRNALKVVSNLAGWSLNNKYEAELIEDIVAYISKKLKIEKIEKESPHEPARQSRSSDNVTPANSSLVEGQLLDDKNREDLVKTITSTLVSQLQPLVKELIKSCIEAKPVQDLTAETSSN